MPKKRGPGRPTMPKGKASSELIGVRVAPEGRAVIEELARKEGLTVSKWARLALMQAAGLKAES